MDEKKQFADRLRAAMVAAGYEPRASVLEAHFNSRYWGRSVTYQAVRRWLIGLSIPEQEKLQVLAGWLGVEPHTLRYGRPATGIAEPKATWSAKVRSPDREAIDAFLILPTDCRKLVRELIAMLASRPGRPGKRRRGDDPV